MRVTVRFYGATENAREVQMDMREMVDKVKKGEPLYGHSTLSPYMQGVASRNSRYTGTFLHIMPWFNVVNHEHVRSKHSENLKGSAKKAYSMVLIRLNIISKLKGSLPLKRQQRPPKIRKGVDANAVHRDA